MYTVFGCRKCGHQVYVKECEDFGAKLGKIADEPCPNCGEECENWILLFRADEFPYD